MVTKPHPYLKNEVIEVKEFDELNPNEVADFLSEHKIPYLAKTGFMANYEKVKNLYNKEKGI